MFSRYGILRGKAPSTFLAAAAIVLACLAPSAWADFAPARPFPTSWDRTQVFADQFPGSLTDAQNRFAAAHYAGVQKLTAGQIDPIRAYNPNFIMLQYRLGVRDSGDTVPFIHNNTWSSDWATIDAHEDWFVHDTSGNRIYQSSGTFKEYIMDAGGLINGNTTAGWKQFWVGAVSADSAASHADGVFADSSHLPFGVPSQFYSSPIGAPPHTAYIADLQEWYRYTYQQMSLANLYFIPNIGNEVTTLDTTDYADYVHGAMVEGFGTKLSTSDWRLEQNRTLQLIRNDKVYIAQNGVNGPGDVTGRMWLLANFLLLRHEKSFLDLLGVGASTLHWLPEYDLNIGAPLSLTAPLGIDDLKDSGGTYFRRYENGLVLVNPTDAALTFTLAPGDPHELLTPFGGGDVGSDGNPPAGGFTYTLEGSTVTLAPWSGAVLVPVPEPATMAFLVLGLAGLIARRKHKAVPVHSTRTTNPGAHGPTQANRLSSTCR